VERKAFARKLVDTTDRLFTFATAEGSFADFVHTQLAPLFAPVAYRIDAVREFMFRVISQTMIEYRDSPLGDGTAGAVHGGDSLPWARSQASDNFDSLAAPVWQVQLAGLPRRCVAPTGRLASAMATKPSITPCRGGFSSTGT